MDKAKLTIYGVAAVMGAFTVIICTNLIKKYDC